MNLPWGDEKTIQFVTNVSLLSSSGTHGHNIMACEWMHHVSHKPGIIMVCVSKNKATHENITKTKKFGISICSENQNILASLSGRFSGKTYDKIAGLKELGFEFYQGEKTNCYLSKDSVLNLECKLIHTYTPGSHTLFFGEVISSKLNSEKKALCYHKGKYGTVNFNIQKPSSKIKQEMEDKIREYKKY